MIMDKRAKGPWKKIILDEIALEGLEGITVEDLWCRFEQALNLPYQTPEKFKFLIWEFIKQQFILLEFYEIPEHRKKLKICDRADFIDNEYGCPLLPDECPFNRPNYKSICEGSIRGSCEFYNERKKISNSELISLSLKDLNAKYDSRFVIVASQDYRESVLFPQNTQKIAELTLVQYCVLEAIGRSRFNGEVTAGKHSLNTYIKEYMDVFYIKIKLFSLQLIVKQPYLEKMNNRISSGYLLTLPRFYTIHKTKPVVMIEALYNVLNVVPSKALEIAILKKNPSFEDISFKKLSKIPIFNKNFELARILYRILYPEADIKLWKNNKTGKEKHLFVIRFKNPKITLEEIFDSVNNESSEAENIEFLSEKHYLLDMPLQEQVYRFIAKHLSVGCSQMQIARYLAVSKYSIRQIINRFLKSGYIKEYATDVGRQRVVMYVTYDNEQTMSSMKGSSTQEIIDESKMDEESIIKLMNDCSSDEVLKPNDQTGVDKVNDVIFVLKETQTPYNSAEKKAICDPKTARHNQRIKLIIDVLNKKIFAEKSYLRKHIITEEVKLGYQDHICSKSLYRIIKWLIDKKMARFYELTLKYKKYVKLLRYTTHIKLEPNFKIFQNEIVKQKNMLLVSLEEREFRIPPNQPITSSKAAQPKIGRENFAKSPKYLMTRFIHELIYFLVYEQDRNVGLIKNLEKIKHCLKESAPDYNFENFDEDVSVGVYDNNLTWKMFVHPLPLYKDKPNGWAYVMDIYFRMPLSIVMKMYQIGKEISPMLSHYINHPIKQHYLIRQLPSELRDILSQFRVIKTMFGVLININWIGLLQCGHRNLKDLRECWIYVNHKARIYDTTTSRTGYRYISSDILYPKIDFEFNTAQDVQNYWNMLYKVCLSTKLGAKSELVIGQAGRSEKDFLQAVDFDQAIKNDTGYIPGDQLGASRLDSSLFSHLHRNWMWRAMEKNTENKPRLTLKKSNEKSIKLKQTSSQKIIRLKQVKRINVKRTKQMKQLIKKKNQYDEIDKEALTKMSSLRVSWSKEEDRMLKICRAVYIYLCGSIRQLQRFINSSVFRDILHWSLNSVNKTSKACQRRLRFLIKHRPSPDVITWVQELKQNADIKQRFRIDINKLRSMCPNDAEFINILKILYVKIVFCLNEILKNSDAITKKVHSLLPDTLNKFYSLYEEMKSLSSEKDIAQVREFVLKHRDPNTIEDIEISTINCIMHSTLCCTRDKTLYTIQIFEVYKKFNEDILAKAYKKARDDNLVIQLKFNQAASGSKLISGSSQALSVKYKQQLYLDIPYEAVDLCYKNFVNSLQNFFGGTPSPFVLKTVDSGGFFHLIELLANNQVNLDIELPSKILIVDPNHITNYEEESERIMDHFHLILDNAPKNDYLKYFQEENSSNETKIKFNKTNEYFKLYYNPYDVLSKLPDEFYHFYCALDNLNKVVDLDFSRFNTHTFCPFNCILKCPDLLNSIERIINENKIIIENLVISSEYNEIADTITVINEENIMPIFERLQKCLRENNSMNDKKDFGKLISERKKVNILLITKEILNLIDYSYDNKLELETTISKEDKNKSQDVYVVNLPTLKTTLKESNNKTESDFIIFKNVSIPKKLIRNYFNQDEILKKIIGFSQWSYNGNVKQFLDSDNFTSLTKLEQEYTQILLNHLEKFEMGLNAVKLMELFSDKEDEKTLVKICSILRKHNLIMRVGVENFIYVHKNHVTPWVVNSYHIKRLDKESLLDSQVIVKTGFEKEKRPLENNESDEPAAKKQAISTSDGKRTPKPSQQYQTASSASANVKIKEHVVKEKENIIIRPFPWIRINGSLNRRVLDKWIGVILIDCLLNSGQTIIAICKRFNQLHPMHLRCLLEILQDLNCIKLKVLKKPKNITLFSNYEDEVLEEDDATEFSKMEEIFIITLPNAMVNLSVFIGEKKYTMDFV